MRSSRLARRSDPQPGLAIAVGVAMALAQAVLMAEEGAAVEEAACALCHEDLVSAFARNPHRLAYEATTGHAGSTCQSCHGEAETHLDEGGGLGNIGSFGPDTLPRERSARCLTCHQESHPRFRASHHARAGLACNDCHAVHDGVGAAAARAPDPFVRLSGLDRASAQCIGCHPQAGAEFEMNERHRLHEGTLACTSCHDPHAPSSRRLLGGFKQQACVSCHTDTGGPFVFEHGASRVEGCTACHSAHGSPNRHLLTFQNVAELCYSCHTEVPQFHFGFNPTAPPRFDLTSQCTNCHSAIHGSNFDPHFLQ